LALTKLKFIKKGGKNRLNTKKRDKLSVNSKNKEQQEAVLRKLQAQNAKYYS